MKKTLLLILCSGLFLQIHAQYLPFNKVYEFGYYSSYPNQEKQLLLMDSMIYVIRSEGLQGMNLNTGLSDYYWKNYHELKSIVRDTGSTYVYLKLGNYFEDDYIGRYNSVSQQYENVAGSEFQNENIHDIDVAPNGNLYAVTESKKVFVYDGTGWQVTEYAPYLYNGFNEIRIINDTLSWLRGGFDRFFKFHQGVIDSLYELPSSYIYEDWDVDAAGNLWIAAYTKLVNVAGGNVTEFDASNTPLGTDYFYHVRVGTNGHVWTAGDQSKFLEYDGASWVSNSLPYYPQIQNFILDSDNHPRATTTGNGSMLFTYDGSTWTSTEFLFNPLKNITAMGLNYFATEEGYFYSSFLDFYISEYYDTSLNSYADDITCFTVPYDPYFNNLYFPAYGTHHGIYDLDGFDNSLLPNDTINYIYNEEGTYYIATDSGLVMYNGITYNYFNTQNSPLPSNKITYVGVGHEWSSPDKLFLGTDNGLAIYQAGQWTVFDTSTIPVSHFYVTGVLGPDLLNDTATLVTTLGSGLVKLFPSGGYELYNSSNGLFLDDTAYYITHTFLGKCGDFIVIGTQNHGIAFISNFYYGSDFEYDTLEGIHTSKLVVSTYGGIMLSTNVGLYWATPCGAVEQTGANASSKILWYQQGDNLIITPPEGSSGVGDVFLIDVMVRTLQEDHGINFSGKIIINIGELSTGAYLVRLNNNIKSGVAKVFLTQSR